MSLSSVQPFQPNPIYTTSKKDWCLGKKPSEPLVQNAVDYALHALRDKWLGNIVVEHKKTEEGKHFLFFTCQAPVGEIAFDKVDRIIEKLSPNHPQVQFLNALKLRQEGHA